MICSPHALACRLFHRRYRIWRAWPGFRVWKCSKCGRRGSVDKRQTQVESEAELARRLEAKRARLQYARDTHPEVLMMQVVSGDWKFDTLKARGTVGGRIWRWMHGGLGPEEPAAWLESLERGEVK